MGLCTSLLSTLTIDTQERHMYTTVCTCAYTCMCVCKYIVWPYVLRVHTYVYICVYECMYVCVEVCVHVHTCGYVRVYV